MNITARIRVTSPPGLRFFARLDVPRKWKASYDDKDNHDDDDHDAADEVSALFESRKAYTTKYLVCLPRGWHTLTHTHTDRQRENVSHFELS